MEPEFPIDAAVIEEQSEASPTFSWWEWGFYLFGGIGMFVLASGLTVFLMQDRPIDLTMIAIGLGLNVTILGGGAILMGIGRKRFTWAEWGMRPIKWRSEYWLLIFVVPIALLPLRGVVAILAQMLIEGGFDSMEMQSDFLFRDMETWMGFTVLFTGVGILGPISEELYFRGLLYGGLRRKWGMLASVLVTSTIFGLAHWGVSGQVASAWIMGVALALVYEYTQSLWTVIAIHIINNTAALAIAYAALYLMRFMEFPGF